jgi:hypothetical protein
MGRSVLLALTRWRSSIREQPLNGCSRYRTLELTKLLWRN